MNKTTLLLALLSASCTTLFAESLRASVADVVVATAVTSSASIEKDKAAPTRASVDSPRTVLMIRADIPKKAVVPKPKEVQVSAAQSTDPVDAATVLPVPRKKIDRQPLPGLGVLPGDVMDMKVKSVKVGADHNELIYISLNQLNKISTPFENPQAIDASGATLKAVGQDLFIKPNSADPITIYVTNGGVGQSIGLTLVPRANMPAQSIVIQPESVNTGVPTQNGNASAPELMANTDYASKLTFYIKSLALEKTPSGFTKVKLPRAIATTKQMIFQPDFKYTGNAYDIFTYKIQSISDAPIELSEESFYSDSVRAVAFYPLALLQKGEETIVIVIADRNSTTTGNSK